MVGERVHEPKRISVDITVVQFRVAKFETKSRQTCFNAIFQRSVTLNVHHPVSGIEIKF